MSTTFTTQNVYRAVELKDQAMLNHLLLDAVGLSDRLAVGKLLRESGALELYAGRGTPLTWAAGIGQIPVVELLLDCGANVNARDLASDTALIRASRYGFREVARMLVERGADIDAVNLQGETALMYAASRSRLAIVGLLAAKGADIEARDRHGRTALMWAVAWGDPATVQLLVEWGARRDVLDYEGNTPEMVARACGHREIEAKLGAAAIVPARRAPGRLLQRVRHALGLG